MVIVSLPQPTEPPPAHAQAVQAELDTVRECLAGDRAAWRRLYDAHFPMVDRLIRSVGIRDAEADDLCQEIFLLIHRHLRHFRGDARLSTWIYKLTVRESIRFARRRRLRSSLARLFHAEHQAITEPQPWWDSGANRRRYLEELLSRLSPERRMALVLFEVEGVPVAEIAQLMGCKENTVWTRLHRARGDLQAQVAKDEDR